MENSQFTAFLILYFTLGTILLILMWWPLQIDNKTVGVNVNLIAYGLNVLQRNISLCDIDYQGIGNTKIIHCVP